MIAIGLTKCAEAVRHALGFAPSTQAPVEPVVPVFSPAPSLPSQSASIVQIGSARRKRRLSPMLVAVQFVAHLREEGVAAYPMTSSDIDAEVSAWAAEVGIELRSLSLVREALATLPGVDRRRTWLNSSNPGHRAIASRLRARGLRPERATLFHVSEVAPYPQHDEAAVEAAAGGRSVLSMNQSAAARESQAPERRRAAA